MHEGVARIDRRLKEEDFLLEMVSSEQLRWILLPFGRKRILWDLFMFLLVGKQNPREELMLPCHLSSPRMPSARARCSVREETDLCTALNLGVVVHFAQLCFFPHCFSATIYTW